MKLFVIVLCLLSERFLLHALSFHRFSWFKGYCHFIARNVKSHSGLSSPSLLLLLLIIPLALVPALLLFILGGLLYGFLGLILNIVIFHYCLGPQNPFYPVTEKKTEDPAPEQGITSVSGRYLAEVNGQLFAVLFWYILTGPVGIIIYRSISLSQGFEPVAEKAGWATSLLDWIPARMTALLYMLVGNFQQGIHYLGKYFIAAPEKNHLMLSKCGLASASIDSDKSVSITAAESLVEHSVIVFLVFLALFTLAAWL